MPESVTAVKVTAPTKLRSCAIALPPSKSVVNRLLILDPDLSVTDNACEDIKVMKKAVAIIVKADHSPLELHLKSSGTAMRFITALCAVTDGVWLLTGDTRQYERPVKPLVDALRSAGANIEYAGKEGFPPLIIKGSSSLPGGEIEIDGSQSSQFISALMLIADKFVHKLKINITGKKNSTPYIALTRELVKKFKDLRGQQFKGSRDQGVKGIEADWSAAAFWYEIMAISGVIFDLEGLNPSSHQGDRIIEHLINEIIHHPSSITHNLKDTPDIVQPLVVTCCMLGVPFRFTGVMNLRIKETDRLHALQTELQKLGYAIEVEDDAISWKGNASTNIHPLNSASTPLQLPLNSPSINPHHDHRMAMSFAPCALKLGSIVIEDPDVVGKSYPTFWDDLRKAGFEVQPYLQ